MFRLFALFAVAVACVSAAPGTVLAPYVAPIAPAVVTAHSSQVVARNYNGLAAPLVAAPVAAPLVAAPVLKSAPYVAAPYAAAPYVASPYVASPYAAPYLASPYLSSPYVSRPAYYL